MNHSAINIVDLPDEILLHIFNKFSSFDVLYSISGVHKRLDKVVNDIVFTRAIDLSTIPSIDGNNSCNHMILTRFCSDILPRIRHKIECFTLQSSSMEFVFHAGNYPKLYKLTLLNLKLDSMSSIFNDDSPFAHMFKHQISHLSITADEESTTTESMMNLVTHIYARIFAMLTNLTHLDFVTNNHSLYEPPCLKNLPSTTCSSSSIVYLRVRVNTLDDCICLLDGRLSQLHTFIVIVDETENSATTVDNTKILWKLKYFSLSLLWPTSEYNNRILPLLQRMTQLENLTLSFVVENRSSFIDGTHLNNEILSKMPHLNTFIFDIVTNDVEIANESLPSCDDIRRMLIEKGHHADCYIDYDSDEINRCHLYLFSLKMKRMRDISNNFPGGLFMNVRILCLSDQTHSFEHEFFARISSSFPLVTSISVFNYEKQKHQRSPQINECEQISSVIEYSHLEELNVASSHIDYAKQFLLHTNTRLPSLKKLRIEYEHLITVTETSQAIQHVPIVQN